MNQTSKKLQEVSSKSATDTLSSVYETNTGQNSQFLDPFFSPISGDWPSQDKHADMATIFPSQDALTSSMTDNILAGFNFDPHSGSSGAQLSNYLNDLLAGPGFGTF
jgi:hypothetical protein